MSEPVLAVVPDISVGICCFVVVVVVVVVNSLGTMVQLSSPKK